MNCFLDTSALIKLYHKEQGSKNLETYLENSGDELLVGISGITPIEFRSAFYRRVRSGDFTTELMNKIFNHFKHDLEFIEIVEISNRTIQEATSLMDQFASTYSLRTLDAIQLASAVIHHQTIPVDIFIASDKTLLQAASQYFSIYNPADN